MSDFKNEKNQAAVEAIREASHLARMVRAEMTASEMTKGDRSPVTVGDFAVQALIGSWFEKKFPEDVLVGEEDSKSLRKPENQKTLEQVAHFLEAFGKDWNAEKIFRSIDRGTGKPGGDFWTLDPIDGTKGFIRGDQYAVALSYLKEGKVQLGVLGCPNFNRNCEPDIGGEGCVVVAERGKGTWVSSLEKGDDQFRPLHVSDHEQMQDAVLLRSFEAAHTNQSRTAEFMKQCGFKKEPLLMDSQAKYAVVASGQGDVFFYLLPKENPDYRMKIWDVAAASLVVEEAGGRITDLEGKDLDFTAGYTVAHNPGIVISNGKLHDQVLSFLNKICKTK